MKFKNSVLNFITDFLPYILIGFLGFVKLPIFIDALGSDKNGLILYFTQLFSFFALFEAGYSGAFSFKLYKHINEKDDDKLSKVYSLATNIYRKIFYVMVFCALLVTLIMPFMIAKSSLSFGYIRIIFLLYFLDFAIPYLLINAKNILICANQKKYKINICTNVIKIISLIIEIILLLSGIDLLILILVTIMFTLLRVCIVNYIFKNEFKNIVLIKSKNINKKETTNELKDINSMSKYALINNIANIVNYSTDTIIITKSLGLVWASIYGAYDYIRRFLDDTTSSIFISITDSFGSLFVEDKKRAILHYKKVQSFSFWMGSLLNTMFAVAAFSFINITFGSDYKLSLFCIFLFSFLLYYKIVLRPISVLRNVNGLYKFTVVPEVLCAIINITLSILLVKRFNVAGVLIGSIVSLHVVNLTIYIKNVLNHIEVGLYKEFFIKYIFNTLIFVLFIFIINYTNVYSFATNYINWFLISLALFVLMFIIYYFYYYVTDIYFRDFIKYIKNIIFNKRKRSS